MQSSPAPASRAVLIAEEEVHGGDGGLAEWLGRQPPWSDLPVLILARAGASSAAVAWAMEQFGNVIVLERPAPVAALVSAVRSALRARQRQYQLRDQLFQRERFADPLNIAMAAHPGSWQVNLTTGEFSASDRAIELHGLPPGTHLNHERALACVHPDDRASIEAALRQTLESGKPFRHEYRMPQPDGSVRWVSSHAERRGEGNQTCVVGHVQDITDRKQAEEALRASEERFRLAADAVNGIIYEWDILTGHVERQRGLYQVLGYHAAEIPPTAAWWREQIHPDDMEVIERQFMKLAGSSVVGEYYRVRHRDGRWLHVEDRAVLLRDDAGQPVKMIGCTVDVTERREADAELRRRETFSNGILGSITDGFGVVCKDWRFTFANDEVVHRFGKQRDEILGNAMWDMLPDAVGNHAYVQLHRAMAERVAVEYEVYYEPWQRWYLDKAFPTADGGLAVYSRDITDRKRAEERLRYSEHLHRIAFDQSPTGMVYVGLDGRFIKMNPRMCEITGYPAEELVGMKVYDLTHPDDRVHDAELVTRFQRGDTQTYENDKRYVRKDAGVRWVSITARMVTDAEGRPLHSVGVILDITERKRAEQALADRTELLNGLLEGTTDVIFVKDLNGRLLLANAAFAAAAISTPEQLVGKTDEDWFPPDVAAAVRQQDEAVIAGGSPMQFEETIPVAGEARVFLTLKAPLRDGSSRVVGILGISRDVTERKRIEETLKTSEARLRQAVDVAGLGIKLIDYGTNTVVPDATAAALFGLEPGVAVPRAAVHDRFHPDDRAEVLRLMERSLDPTSDGTLVMEHRVVHPDGSTKWLSVRKQVVFENVAGVGRPVSGVLVAVNITARMEGEAALQASEERRRLALDAAELGVWQVDPATRATKTDARYRAIFGTTEEWTDYLQAVAVIHPDDQPVVLEAVAAATRPENPTPYVIEYRIVHPDGSLRWVLANGRPSFEGTGPTRRVVNFDGTVMDITDRKRAEEEREQLVGRLREQDLRKDEFLATLAHELRNPLAPLRNGLQVIRLAGANGTVEQARAMMDRQLTQLVRLVDDLLDVSRVTSGKLEFRKERVELGAVIDAAVETARPVIEGAGHEFVVAVPDEPIFVDGDHTRLAQAVSNLLHNSAKYTHRGGHVRLTVGREDGMAVVSVKDNGIGIPPAMLDKVFVMFTQVDRTLEKTTGGLGIGLSLVKGLLDMHGGTIEAKSDGEGMGSEFVVRVPVAMDAVAGSARPDMLTSEVTPSAVRRILVVDDNADAADSLGLLLEMSGHEVRTANDGEAGIAVAAQFQPDLVLMDIGMPKLNGYEAARRIRQHPWGRGMVLVALTGWGHEDDRKKSADAGFDHHLVKPVEMDALMKLISS